MCPGLPPFAYLEPQSLNQPELTHHSVKPGIYEISNWRRLSEGEKDKKKSTTKHIAIALNFPKPPISSPLSPAPGTGIRAAIINHQRKRLSELKYLVTMATEPCTRGPGTQVPKRAAWQGLPNVSTSLPCAGSPSTPAYTSPGIRHVKGLGTGQDCATSPVGKRRQRQVARIQVTLGASASTLAGPKAKLLRVVVTVYHVTSIPWDAGNAAC